MKCRTCETNPLFCTVVAGREFNYEGNVRACQAYKPYKRVIKLGLWHTIFIAIAFIFYSFIVGIFVGHELTWKTAEQQQVRDLRAMFKDGLQGGKSFYLPKNWNIATKFIPRKDGRVNVSNH